MQIERLLAIMARLRDPERGCPWTREQTWSTIVPHTLEEAYELADAVADGIPRAFATSSATCCSRWSFRLASPRRVWHFAFDDVAAAISRQVERRQPPRLWRVR